MFISLCTVGTWKRSTLQRAGSHERSKLLLLLSFVVVFVPGCVVVIVVRVIVVVVVNVVAYLHCVLLA